MYRSVLLFLSLLAGKLTELNAQARIVGGRQTNIRRFPYQVSLMSDGNHICGGVIIRQGTILTAAHCVFNRDPSSLSIRAGSDFRTSGGIVVEVRGYRRHPRFNRSNLNFDLALVYLQENLTFSEVIRAIPLYTRRLRGRSAVVASGWGTQSENGQLSDVIRSTQFRIISRRRCQRIFGRNFGRGMFCAGRLTGGKDTCQGDSGGPLVMNAQLVGITSNGNGCGRRGFPGLYSKVPLTRRWINRFA